MMGLSTEELARSLASDVLHLVVMPTEACNFRCTYCYETFEHGRMRPEIVAGLKRLIGRHARSLHRLDISWFGGEPLLAPEVVESVMLHAKTHSQRRGFGLSADITTNGWYLTHPMFERLLDLGVRRYQVSMDGPREWHDRTRRRADGSGTFEVVWRNLLAMHDVDGNFDICVRLHATAENRTSLTEFVEMFADAFRGDRRFRLLLKSISPLGGPQDADFPFLDDNTCDSMVRELQAKAASAGIVALDARDMQPVCYASRGNSFVVRADGRLGKCTVALDAPGNQVGRLHPSGRIELSADAMLAWMRGLWSEDDAELACPKLGLVSSEARPARVAWRASVNTPIAQSNG